MYLLQTSIGNQVNWITVIASILGGGVVSSIISFFSSQKLKRTDFDYDYRKYILEKRKCAYKWVETMIEIFEPKGFIRRIISDAHSQNEKDLQELIEGYSEALQKRNEIEFWISPMMLDHLDIMEHSLNNLRNLRNYYKSNEHQKATIELDRFVLVHTSLIEIYFKDILELGQLDGFKKNKLKANKKRTWSKSIDFINTHKTLRTE